MSAPQEVSTPINTISRENLRVLITNNILNNSVEFMSDSDTKGVKATDPGLYKPVPTPTGIQMLALIDDEEKALSNTCYSASNYVSIGQSVVSSEVLPHQDTLKNNHSSSLLNSKSRMKNKNIPNKNNYLLKNQLYRKKLECAVLEYKTKLLEYRLALKKETLLDIEIKIKEKEYENILNKDN